MNNSCFLRPGIQRTWEIIILFNGKGRRSMGFGKTSLLAAPQLLSGKDLMGTMRRLSDENHRFTVSCFLKSGQSCPQTRTSKISWVSSLLITQRRGKRLGSRAGFTLRSLPNSATQRPHLALREIKAIHRRFKDLAHKSFQIILKKRLST